MRVIPLKTYSDFKKLIPNRFIESKGAKLHEFRVTVGNAVQRYRDKYFITTGNEDYRDERWQEWISPTDFGSDPDGEVLATLKDSDAGELHRGRRHTAFYITLYYKLHSILDDLSYADDIDNLVFGEPLRNRGDAVFTKDTKPIAHFIHPPFVTEEYVVRRLEEDPTDGIWLNPHNHYSIKLTGREDEWERLEDFINDDRDFLICPVIGPAGAGKTRLVSQWMKQYVPSENATEWDSGMVESRNPELWNEDSWEISCNTLILIDYTFAYDGVVKEIARRARHNANGNKIRLIVLDHVFPNNLFMDVLWRGIYESRAMAESKREKELFKTLRLNPEDGKSRLLRNIAASVASLGKQKYMSDDLSIIVAIKLLHSMGENTEGGMNSVNTDAVRHPLFAALLGQAIRDGRDYVTWNRRDLIDYYFTNEKRLPWRIWNSDSGKDGWGISVGAIICTATLQRGLVLHNIEHLIVGEISDIVQYAQRVVSDNSDINLSPFEPDILGESFLLKYIKHIKNNLNAWSIFMAMITSIHSPEEEQRVAFNMQETIGRLCRNLANDQQTDQSVYPAWSDLLFFLKPAQFENYEKIKIAIAYQIPDTMAHIADITSNLDNAHRLKTYFDGLLAQLARQFPIDDIVRQAAGDDWFAAVEAFFKYFEFSPALHKATSTNSLFSVGEQFSNKNVNQWTSAMLAAHFGYVGVLQAFLLHDIDEIERFDKNGNSLLMIACESGQESTFRRLLKYKTSISVDHCNLYGETALMLACRGGNNTIVESLLKVMSLPKILAFSKSGQCAMFFAASAGFSSVIEALLQCDRLSQISATHRLTGNNALLYALKNGHKETALVLLSFDASIQVEKKCNMGLTPLMVACAHGFSDVVEKVLSVSKISQIIEVDGEGDNALIISCNKGHHLVVKLLLKVESHQQIATFGKGRMNALMSASVAGYSRVVNELLKCSPEVQVKNCQSGNKNALICASKNGHADIVKLLLSITGIQQELISMPYTGTALNQACEGGHLGVVEVLLEMRGYDQIFVPASKTNMIPLLTACKIGSLAIVKLLLRCSPNAQLHTYANGMRSALMFAAASQQTKIVEFLLSFDVDIQTEHVDVYRRTVLMQASQKGDAEIVDCLLRFCSLDNINAQNKNGETALILASKHGNMDVVISLVKVKGIDLYAVDKFGKTAIFRATESGYFEAEMILRTAMKIRKGD